MKNAFLSEMSSRGFLNQCTDLDKLDKITKEKQIKAYIGFDSTAPSLHVGSFLNYYLLKIKKQNLFLLIIFHGSENLNILIFLEMLENILQLTKC